MALITPAEFVDSKEDKKSIGVDFSFFSTKDAKFNIGSPVNTEPAEKKRGRPPKKKTAPDGSVYVAVDDDTNLPAYQTNEPYIDTFNETNFMLKTSIGQIDNLNNDVKSDIDSIRSSKTLKNKYRYITDLTGTSGSLLTTKIAAIRELNSTINNCHNLELKRIKELNIGAKEEGNDDRKILDMYSAFVNTPVGSYQGMQQPLGPSIQDMTLMNGINDMIRADINVTGQDMGFNGYIQNLTPEQNRMRLENNPNIQTVVVFNQDNGQRYFDVVDKSTGMSVPNVSRPDNFLLDDTVINTSTMMARNTNLDQSYPVVLVGQNASILEY